MPALLIFIVYFAIALLSGAAISYPTYLLLANWFELDFDRVVSRMVLIMAIILFIALFRKLGFASWQDIGYNTDKKRFFGDLIKGVGIGILIMSPVVIGLLLTKNRIIDMGWEFTAFNIIGLLLTSLIAGLIIGFIEETLFRGAMLSAIKKHGSVIFAVIASSLVYALIHFAQPEIELDQATLSWGSGFILVKNALLGMTDFPRIFDSFIALFLAGVLLSVVRLRTNRIAFCIGIHAGWVLVIKVFKRVTDSHAVSEYAFLSGSYDKVIGYLAAVSIMFFIFLILKFQVFKTNSEKILD